MKLNFEMFNDIIIHFIQYVLNKGAEYFDANHIIIKMFKNEVIEMF